MSLFGTTPPDNAPLMDSSPAQSRHGLFEDPPKSKSSHDGLFDDEAPSPWDIPSRKQKSRAELLRNLLPTTDVPDAYNDLFNGILRDGGAGLNTILAGSVARTLAASKLSAYDQAKIMSIIAPGGSEDIALSQNEFNVLLALIGLAQEGEIVSLDGVDERRKNLPYPSLPGLVAASSIGTTSNAKPRSTPSSKIATPHTANPPALSSNKISMDYTPDDPWNTPDVHRNHQHTDIAPGGSAGRDFIVQSSEASHMRAIPNVATPPETATTAAGDGGGEPPQSTVSNAMERQAPSSGWDAYGGIGNPATDSDGFAGTGVIGTDLDGVNENIPTQIPGARQTSRTIGSGRTGSAVEENIIVKLMPEKEGVFLFQHHNYEVISTRRGSKVIRRYSDFVWLLECLLKRYPFRVLPLLPPKRVAVNGNHLSNDGAFIEKRRRGLARFLNALTRHPILSVEQLVVMFLTVPTELSVWRKQAAISVKDEFADRPLPPGLEESLSPQLQDLFDRTRSGVRRSADLYITVCNIMDRLVKRGEGVANDHARLALSLQSLTEVNPETYATDTNDVPLLNDGLVAMSKHLRTGQTLMEDEAKAWDIGVLEDLKRQRDALVGLRDLFDRRDRLDRDNIPYLEQRIRKNETKLADLRAKAEGLVNPEEVEKVVVSIIKDKESIVNQHNRSVFVKECLRDELVYFQSTQYHVSRWNQDWAQERVKYSEMLADNWRCLLDELDGMPLGD